MVAICPQTVWCTSHRAKAAGFELGGRAIPAGAGVQESGRFVVGRPTSIVKSTKLEARDCHARRPQCTDRDRGLRRGAEATSSETQVMTYDSKSYKVQHYLNAISLKVEASLLTIDNPPESSSDLERAPGAHSIADVFLNGPSIVT